MKHLFTTIVCAFASVLIVGCASGPTYSEVKATLPPIPKGQGRIFVYRTALLGAAVQPKVKINDVVVGQAKPRGFFYADRLPGHYEVSATTEWKHKDELTLAPGQRRFVRLNMLPGLMVGHISPEVVADEATGESEIAKCSLLPPVK